MKEIHDPVVLKQILVSLFEKFIHICKNHNLKYFCLGGTLLGAVRHQGMIPWDDDIDVAMPRPDYDKLLELLSGNTERYQIAYPKTENSYPVPYAKFVDTNTVLVEGQESENSLGVYVDIFPFDGGVDDMALMTAHRAKFIKNKILLTISSQASSSNWKQFKARIKDFQLRSAYYELKALLNRRSLRKQAVTQLNNIVLEYPYEGAEVIGNYSSIYGLKEFGPKEWFENVIKMSFENLEVNVPIGYDKFLTQVYGDYMQLPPEHMRVSHHNRMKLYIKD